jgi:glutathione S-transferase
MGKAVLSITSKNYSSWSLRGWLMMRMSGLAFEEKPIPPDDPEMRADILLLSSSIRIPRLEHDGVVVWDVLAIGEYLAELEPRAGLLPADRAARAHCRSICGEMHSGFVSLRSALPMNIKARFPSFKVWSRAQADIDRVIAIWTDCHERHGGPWLFGERPTIADAMYAPVATRFVTYDVSLPKVAAAYRDRIVALPEMKEWAAAALAEPEDIEELEVEF